MGLDAIKQHPGSHGNYNIAIGQKLDEILQKYPNITPDQAANQLDWLIFEVNKKINKYPDKSINSQEIVNDILAIQIP
jgi:hypothetical protein